MLFTGHVPAFAVLYSSLIGYFLDVDSKMMTVSVCASEDDSFCQKCVCLIGDCTQYDFAVWMRFGCNDLHGNYVKLTNEEKNFNVAAEIEAYGYVIAS